MNNYSRFQLENQILIKCSVVWPYLEHKPVSFQKNIGTTFSFDKRSTAELPLFSLSLFRREECSSYFETLIAELKVHVNDSWCIDVDYDLANVTERNMLPEKVFGCRIGSFTIEDLDRLKSIAVKIVDYIWTSWQAFYLENTQTRNETGGLTGTDLHDLYRKYWYEKDGSKYERGEIDTHLFVEYRNLARQRMRARDVEGSAQYSQVCLNVAKDLHDVEREILDEFGMFAEKWNQLTAQKENLTKKHATVAREGSAEFHRIEMSRLGRENLIMALDPNYQHSLRNLDYDKDRAELLRKSSSNPYRRGFELVENISSRIGPVSLSMWGILTEWPLEELRLRVPAYAVEQLQKNSPLAPDFRAVRLAQIGEANDLFKLPERTNEDLYLLFDLLDKDILGIGKCALVQLDCEKKRSHK